MDGVAFLVRQTYKQDNLGQHVPEAETKDEIFVSEESITRAEFFSAGKNGMKPEIMLKTATVNYSGQREVEYEGARYSIYRTHKLPETDEIELYLQKKEGVQNGKD